MDNPLQVPELLEHILSFVALADLRASSLVDRSWVYPSQSRIFSTIELVPDAPLVMSSRFGRLLAALETSQHLAGFVLELGISHSARVIEPGYLERLANLPFSRLSTLRIHSNRLSSSDTAAVQRLLRIPSLISVTLNCRFPGWAQFLQVWDECSPSIKHLWCLPRDNPQTREPIPYAVPRRIKLESLATSGPSDHIALWLKDSRCPFDVSGLTAFKFYSPITQSLFDVLRGSQETIRLLSLTMSSVTEIYLSRFGNLTHLDIWHLWNDGFHDDFQDLRDMAPEVRNRIEAIRFQELRMVSQDLYALDGQLANIHEYFPKLRMVQINFHTQDEGLRANVAEYSSSLNPRITVCHNFDADKSVPWYTISAK
ncbi:hypothetical protein FB45DRAFT_890254 [Roridomyces roridus]|uniref:F-box domain-containing protein n=1 Tax=Roridomyces roridus TaxID=1738132 RepID=A0AAD7CKX5_9AGAR|nr:hypothetical protein FB45DRAFT_890254 [Roridomyces roridus]